jgi:hypothetical protein
MNLLREKMETKFQRFAFEFSFDVFFYFQEETSLSLPSLSQIAPIEGLNLVMSSLLLEKSFLRKEVIQPQVPLRLPCYDFTPVTNPTFAGGLLLLGYPDRLLVESAPMV